MKRIYAFFVLLVGTIFPLGLNAQVVFTEVMYDAEGTDTGREWMEIQNSGSAPVDISDWKLLEANTNHKITPLGSGSIPAGGFAIIADVPDKFKIDFPSYSGLLFDSTFSLSNAGETIALKDQAGADADVLTYVPASGADGTGASLQKASSGWIPALPTPGAATAAVEPYVPPASGGSGSETASSTDSGSTEGETQENPKTVYSSHSNQAVATISYDEPELIVTSGRSRLGYVGVPLSFEAKVKSIKNVQAGNTVGSVWSMGDGTQASGQFISHAYEFPGDYNVILNSSTGGASAVSKTKVRIVEPKVTLVSVGSDYVEIKNSDSYELNIGGWVLATVKSRYNIPQDTIISPRSSIRIPLKVARITLAGETQLLGPSGKVWASLGRAEMASISSPSSGDMIISEALNPEVIKSKYLAAVREGELRAASKPSVELQKEAATVQHAAQKSSQQISPAAMEAAVIYTVSDKGEGNWWGKLKNLFKK